MEDQDRQRVAAFQRLAEERLYKSYRLANAILGDETESQDAVHDAVVVAWQRWGSLRDPAKFESWFARIVVNVARDRLRRGSRQRTTDISTQTSLNTPDASVDVHRRIALEQAFARLKPDDIVVLALRHFMDLEIEDIAALLDVPLPTAKTRLRSARMRLRDRIERQSSDEAAR